MRPPHRPLHRCLILLFRCLLILSDLSLGVFVVFINGRNALMVQLLGLLPVWLRLLLILTLSLVIFALQ
jgi:hypothetical protein